MNPANNPPVTAATIAGAINALILAFDIGHLTAARQRRRGRAVGPVLPDTPGLGSLI